MTIHPSPVRGACLARKRPATRASHASGPMTQAGGAHPERRGRDSNPRGSLTRPHDFQLLRTGVPGCLSVLFRFLERCWVPPSRARCMLAFPTCFQPCRRDDQVVTRPFDASARRLAPRLIGCKIRRGLSLLCRSPRNSFLLGRLWSSWNPAEPSTLRMAAAGQRPMARSANTTPSRPGRGSAAEPGGGRHRGSLDPPTGSAPWPSAPAQVVDVVPRPATNTAKGSPWARGSIRQSGEQRVRGLAAVGTGRRPNGILWSPSCAPPHWPFSLPSSPHSLRSAAPRRHPTQRNRARRSESGRRLGRTSRASV